VIVGCDSLEIICVAHGRGRRHDKRVFDESETRLRPETELLGDGGYQGVGKTHAKSRTPHKRWRERELNQKQRLENQWLASERIAVEHVIRRLKVFRVLKGVYRHRRRRFGLRVNLIAGLYNYDLKLAA
jgi:hypothetical protein